MQIEMELSRDCPTKVRSVRWCVKDGLFTKLYQHDFKDGELPDANMALNILITSLPD